jgi:hypothetical protein
MTLRIRFLAALVAACACVAIPQPASSAGFIFDNYTNGFDAGNLHYPYRRYTPWGWYDINGWHNFKYDVARVMGPSDPPVAPLAEPELPRPTLQEFSLGRAGWQTAPLPAPRSEALTPPAAPQPAGVRSGYYRGPEPYWETDPGAALPPEGDSIHTPPMALPPQAASFGRFSAQRLTWWPYSTVPPQPIHYDGYFDSGLDYRVGYYRDAYLDAPDHNAKYRLGYQGNHH